MDTNATKLAALKGPRAEILVALKREQPLTAKALADRLGVSANAIRHHLKELEAEGMIGHGREHHAVGAPTHVYHLSPSGERLFPKRYEETIARLLNHIVQREGRDAAASVLDAQYDQLSRRLGTEMEAASPEERIEKVARVLEEAGYMAEWRKEKGRYQLTVLNCAIHAVAQHLPEVCDHEEQFLRANLDAGIERRAHIIDGCNACEYHVTFNGAPGTGPSAGPDAPEPSA